MFPRITCWKLLTVTMATANFDGGPCVSLCFIAVAGKWFRVLSVTQALRNWRQSGTLGKRVQREAEQHNFIICLFMEAFCLVHPSTALKKSSGNGQNINHMSRWRKQKEEEIQQTDCEIACFTDENIVLRKRLKKKGWKKTRYPLICSFFYFITCHMFTHQQCCSVKLNNDNLWAAGLL